MAGLDLGAVQVERAQGGGQGGEKTVEVCV